MKDDAIILIVDSDETSSILLQEILFMVLPSDCNYQILSIPYGTEAIGLCCKQRPKAVFTEIRLKDMDGFRLVKHIKESYPDIPVIIETAIPWEYVKQQACECCCDGYLTKPLDIKNLYKFLQSVF